MKTISDKSEYVECRQCKIEKLRTRAERRVGERGYRYRDVEGKMWRGFICGACYNSNCRRPRAKGSKNFKDEIDDGTEMLDNFEANPITNRKCRKCTKFLTKSRYFYHQECAPKDIVDLLEGLEG